MSELGDEVRSTIEGAATPVTLDELSQRGSARERRAPRAPWRTFVAGVAVTALVVVGAVVVVNLGDDKPPAARIAAPTVVVGDIDLAVLSTAFDDDGARRPIDPSLVDTVRAIPGVAGRRSAMQRFVDVVRTDTTVDAEPGASGGQPCRDLVGGRRAAHVQRRRSAAAVGRDRHQPVARHAVLGGCGRRAAVAHGWHLLGTGALSSDRDG